MCSAQPGITEVHHEQHAVGRLERVHDPAFDVVAGDRRQVDELKVEVFEGHHPRLGQLGRERVGADVGLRARQLGVQLGLAGVGRADQGDLGRAFAADRVDRALLLAALFGGPDFLGDLLDPALDVALEVIGALVLRNGPKHLLEVLELLRGFAGVAVGLFGLAVDGCEIGGHGSPLL